MDFIQKLKFHLYQLRERTFFWWIALFTLNALFLIPELIFNPESQQLFPIPSFHDPRGWYDAFLYYLRRENIDVFRVVVDYFVLLNLLALFARTRFFNLIRRISLGVFIFLLLFQIYDVAMFYIFAQHPILYNDIRLLLGGFYLLVDLSFSKLLITILMVIIPGIFIFLLIPFLFNSVVLHLRRKNIPRSFLIGSALIWILVLGLTLWFGFKNNKMAIRWITPKLITNLYESYQVSGYLDEVKKMPVDSTHYFFSDLNLVNKPNLYMIMIESYGKVLTQLPGLDSGYAQLMQKFEGQLEEHGWLAATNFSEAPISGGISWLSISTVLNGMKIKDQALYTYLLNQVRNLPNLIYFLKKQDYHTFNLQPMNRQRAGYSLDNYNAFYNFNTPIYFDSLNFEGNQFGFGFIPDQYCLFFTHEHYLKHTSTPYFLFFMTASSHYPWNNLPTYLDDWQSLRHLKDTEKDTSQLIRKVEDTYHIRFFGEEHLQKYLQAMDYEFTYLTQYILNQAPENSWFIILGDHQPPIVTREEHGFQTPIHIISREPALVDFLRNHGFHAGMRKDPRESDTIKHEAIFSLLVRGLAYCYGQISPDSLPAFQPEGVPLSLIRNHTIGEK
ncbi:MAG: hypothetical protein Kow0042_28800 [Calditrichia bacterium]